MAEIFYRNKTKKLCIAKATEGFGVTVDGKKIKQKNPDLHSDWVYTFRALNPYFRIHILKSIGRCITLIAEPAPSGFKINCCINGMRNGFN